MKIYYDDSDKGFILEVDVEYSKHLRDLHCDLLFLAERVNIKKCHKILGHICNKGKHVLHKRALKQALNHRLTLKT